LTILSSLTGSPDLSNVIMVNVVVQIIDNNILVPVIINTKVQINAFVSIIGIIVGGEWGIAGMFLAIPLAILKIVFDRIESFRSMGLFDGQYAQNFIWKIKRHRCPRNLKLIKYIIR
jgi:predicted PurR-regulated permease PerM